MFRKIAANELATFLGIISHPARIRIVEELKNKELDVSTIQEVLDMSQSSVSQHLATLKAHKVLEERKEGRRVFYHLADPELAEWLIQGLDIVQRKSDQDKQISKALASAKKIWS
jgi:DNA-binding transcriptional ArsR family regulator